MWRPPLNPADADAVREMLRAWPQVQPVRHVEAVTGRGFSGAAIFRVTTDHASYALRRWPSPGLLPEARLRELHRFLAFLEAEGINELAVPIAGLQGTLVHCREHVWQLEPWKPGVSDFLDAPSEERLVNAMQALARLHVVARRYVSSHSGAEWFFQSSRQPSPAVHERLRLLNGWDANRLRVLISASPLNAWGSQLAVWFDWIAPSVRAELESAAHLGVRLHPCLRDVWSDHILFTDQAVTGIIDASAARSENVAADLSRLLGSLLPEGGARWDSALMAYSQVRPLADDERRLIPILDRSGTLLSTLHWVQQGDSSVPVWSHPGSVLRFQTLVHRLERLASERHAM